MHSIVNPYFLLYLSQILFRDRFVGIQTSDLIDPDQSCKDYRAKF